MTSPAVTGKRGAIRLGAVLGLSLGVGLLAACGSSASSSAPPPATSAAAAPTGGSTSAAAASAGLVITTKTGSAGSFLTNGAGRAIYLWEKNPSACTGACLTYWPPVTATGPLTAAGDVNKADLSTVTMSDGSKQVTYEGHALYYFAGDKEPGQVTGQGSDAFGAKWWLVNPAGTAITTAVTVSSGTAPSPSASAGGGGW